MPKTINRECLCEYNFIDTDIIEPVSHGSDQEKIFLFNKIT
ncbi:MAG: hypothetical protein ACQES8_04035 [Thermodesulfobacteriota bacterium]